MKLQTIPLASLVTIGTALALLLVISTPSLAQAGPKGYGPGPGLIAPVTPATPEEVKWLTFMREEEKLARDVYQELGERYNLNIFRNISRSEDQHATAVANLLTRYGIKDPAQDNPAGVYSDASLNALYSELMAKGSVSLKDALEVGVLIEKTDIADLESAMKETAKLDIKRVYTNLLNGSFNHLEAFETSVEVLCPLAPAN